MQPLNEIIALPSLDLTVPAEEKQSSLKALRNSSLDFIPLYEEASKDREIGGPVSPLISAHTLAAKLAAERVVKEDKAKNGLSRLVPMLEQIQEVIDR